MRSAFLDDAQPEAVSHAVRHVLERRGALVSEHRASRVKFYGMSPPHKYSWSRAGYVGIYQHLGEPEVMVRLLLRARWPSRILMGAAALAVIVWIATIALNPSGSVWILNAFLTGFALLVAAILYVGTLRPVREEERGLMVEFEAEFAKGLPGAHIESEELREEKRLTLALEGEVTQRRLKKAAKPTSTADGKGRRFSLRPKSSKQDEPASIEVEDVEAKRARLLARKAELEAQKRRGP